MTSPVESQPTRRQVMTVFVGLMLGMLLASVSQTIVAPAMPRIVSDLGGMAQYSWVAVSAMLASTVVVPLAGKLSDLYGRKAFFVGGIVIFIAGSLVCGAAWSMTVMVAGRVVQGVGMGTLMPLSQAILGDIITPRERGKYQGLMGAVWGLSSIVAPVVGGIITDHLTWRWLFFLNLPLGILALGFIIPFMRIPHHPRPHRLDLRGFFTLSLGLTAVLLATTWGGNTYPWASAPVVGLFALGSLSLVVCLRGQRHAEEPVLPLHLWRNPIFTAANVANMLVAMGMFGALYFLPVFLQGALGMAATRSGMMLIPMTVAMITMSAVNGFAISRTGRYKPALVLGGALLVVGFFGLTLLDERSTESAVLVAVVIAGLGLGMAMQTYTLVVQNAVDHTDLGVATATTQLFRSLGSTTGTAVFGTIMAHGLAEELPHHVPPDLVERLQLGGGASAARLALDPKLLQGLPPEVLEGLRAGMAQALHHVFTLALPVTALALLATLFIKEIPLRTRLRPSAEETGKEVLAELNQAGSGDAEPELGEEAP